METAALVYGGLMASPRVATVEQYLAELPEDRRSVVGAIHAVVNANLPEGYQEAMQYGMIGDDVALDVIGEAIRRLPVAKYIARYDSIRPTTPNKRRH